MTIKRFKTGKIYWKLENYITHEFLFSFFVCFLFYFFIFLLNQLLLLAKQILAKGIPVKSVLLLLLYSLPTFITLTVPFATLTAALMSYGRLASDNEILAMRSIGFNRLVIFRPVLLWGIVLGFLSFFINDFFLPRGNQAFQKLWLELTLTNPGLELEEYSARKFRQSILITGAIDKSGIHPLMVIEKDNSGNRVTLMSKLAAPEIRSDLGNMPGFNMYDIFSIIPDAKEQLKWSWSTAESMEYRVLSKESNSINPSTGPASMRMLDVQKVVKEKKENFDSRVQQHTFDQGLANWTLALNYSRLSADTGIKSAVQPKIEQSYTNFIKLRDNPPEDHSLQVWTLEFFQKFAIPFACIPFVVLAFPLGLTARRSGRAVGFFIGLLLATFYWSLLIVGRSLGLRASVSPFLVMILPDLFLLFIGIVLFMWRSRL
ncbi:MAG: hypothetical protein B0D92_01620 [Spirochaeta sp. LUC14_002_19_P3]|nr:MAG: hypothetical protein B0D92_01620 [Spirochaeta sp. LUC14_002_19_P3]